MRIAIMADIHLRAKDIESGAAVFQRACEMADEMADILIIAGDLFDTPMVGGREAATGTVYAAAYTALQRFCGRKYLLLGNHEWAGPKQNHALVVFAGVENTKIVYSPKVHCDMAFLPYTASPIDIEKVLSELRSQKPVLFVGHCPIVGAQVASGYRPKHSTGLVLTAGQVESVGARFTYFGDYHKAQRFYVGALRQLNFGEEHNPTGFRVIDTETGEDIFVEVESPRYFTVDSLEGATILAAQGHHVKIRATELPAFTELPEGVIYEQLPPEEIVQARVGADFTVDMNPEQLLAMWHDVTNPPQGKQLMLDTLVGLASDAPKYEPAIGSLLSIKRIELKNIAKHNDTDVNLFDLLGITCIDGDNGAGKSTLIEALPLAAYGIAPSYNQELYGMITQGYYGDALVRVTVETADGDFILERTARVTPKTKSQEFTVYDGAGKAVAGGKGRSADADVYVSKLIGDRDLLLASVLAAQKALDLVDLRPADRKDLLSKLLGSERFEPIAKSAKEKAKEQELKAKDAEILAEVRRSDLKALGEPEARLELVRDRVRQLELVVKGAKAEVTRAQEALAEAKAASKAGEVARRVDRASSDLTKAEKALSEARWFANRASDIQRGLVPIDEEAIETERTRVQEVETQADRARKNNEALQNTYASDREVWIRECQRIQRGIECANAALGLARRSAAMLGSPDIGCKGTLPCKFLAEAQKAKDSLPELEADLANKTVHPPCEPTRPELRDVPRVDRSALEQMERTARTQASLRGELAGLGDVGSKIEAARVVLDAAHAEHTAAQAEWTAVLNDTRAATARAVLETAQMALARHEKELSEAKTYLVHTEIATKQAAKLKRDIEEAEGQCALADEQRQLYAMLHKAFSRDGIPQLVMDAAIPRLAELSQQVLDSGNVGSRMLFQTQSATQSGKIVECLNILAWDSETGDYRDVAQFSGGEGTLLRLAIRLAFGMLQAERAGKRVKVFVADESFAALKPERASDALAMLESITGLFNQVFVISHHTEVTSALAQKLFVRKVNGRSVVEAK